MTTFRDWLYRGQTQYDTDELNKREIELAESAWEEAQSKIPDGWRLVPKEPTKEMLKAERHINSESVLPIKSVYQAMLSAAPKFGEEG